LGSGVSTSFYTISASCELDMLTDNDLTNQHHGAEFFFRS